jgi:hypothetical protein
MAVHSVALITDFLITAVVLVFFFFIVMIVLYFQIRMTAPPKKKRGESKPQAAAPQRPAISGPVPVISTPIPAETPTPVPTPAPAEPKKEEPLEAFDQTSSDAAPAMGHRPEDDSADYGYDYGSGDGD